MVRSQQQHMMLFSFQFWQHQQLSSCPQEALTYPLPPLHLPQSPTFSNLRPFTSDISKWQTRPLTCASAARLLQSNDPPHPQSGIICFPEEGGQQRCSCRSLTSVNRLRGNSFGLLETPHGKLKSGLCKNWLEDGRD